MQLSIGKIVNTHGIRGELKVMTNTDSLEERFAKGNEALRDQVQSALEEMAKDGTLAEISTKWFGEDITTIGK